MAGIVVEMRLANCSGKPGGELCEPSHPEKKNAVVNVFRWWYSLLTQF